MKSGIKKWQVAQEIGVADTTFSKWLRKPLPEDKKAKVLAAISKLSKGVE